MAELSRRHWFWFAGMALMLALPQPAAADVVLGDGSGVFVDPAAIDASPVEPRFSAFSRPALLMPGEARATAERIVLVPPGGRKSFGGKPLLVPPRGVSSTRLLVSDNQRIVLTPPAGMPVHLVRPSAAKARAAASDEKRVSALAAVKPPLEKPAIKAAPAAPAAEPAAPETPVAKPILPPAIEKAPEAPVAKPVEPPAQRSSLPAPAPAKPVETPEPALPPGEPMPLIPPPDAVKAAPPAPTPSAAPAAPMIEAPSTPIADIPAAPAAPLEPMTTVAVATPTAIPAPPAGADAPVATPKATVVLSFDPADARLNEAHRALLKDIAVQLSEDSDASVQLLAYAQAENRSKARRLSLSRALAVRSYLLSQDVRNTRIEVRALGDQVPAGKPDRVDVVLQRP